MSSIKAPGSQIWWYMLLFRYGRKRKNQGGLRHLLEKCNKSKKVISIKDKMLKSDWPKNFKDSIKGWIGPNGEFINGFCIYAISQNLTTTK